MREEAATREEKRAAQRRRRETERRTFRRRRLTALAMLLALILLPVILLGSGGGGGGDNSEKKGEPATLPGGGRRIFPDRRVVAFYGAPQSAELGELGIGPADEVAQRLQRQARPYSTRGRPVLPAFELIAAVAANAPGSDSLYRTRQHETIIRNYLTAARKAGALLVLDIQPGRADFLTEAQALERWLREPDVGLALDPEWRMEAGEVPGQTIGSVDAEEVNSVSSWLAGLVRSRDLPQKLLLVHRFTENMVERPELLTRPRGLAMTLNVDGFGTQDQKVAKYRALVPHRFRAGFKLFYREDTGLMTPRQVLGLRPQPDLIVYE